MNERRLIIVPHNSGLVPPTVRHDKTGLNAPDLRSEVEPGAVYAILDLNNPKIRVERQFPLEPLLRLIGIDRRFLVRAREKPFDAGPSVCRHGLWSRLVKGRTPVQVIDFDENRASLGGAATAQDGAHPFHSAPTQIGRDPNV